MSRESTVTQWNTNHLMSLYISEKVSPRDDKIEDKYVDHITDPGVFPVTISGNSEHISNTVV
jgi:hypothetical protein